MSVGSWNPDGDAQNPSFEIETNILHDFIAISEQEQLADIKSALPEAVQIQQRPLMTLSKETWFVAAEPFTSEQLLHLVRFFTLAEMQLSGWEAGAESPVIWIVKTLRRRKSPPSKELLLWIKANSDNRFIPNGAL
jgi:hypothetical protein